MKLKKDFFLRDANEVAKDLLGKVLVRVVEGKILKARIVEVEAYFDENDPASWARFGKRKDNILMWDEGGTILVKNVHKYFMLNFVTGFFGKAEAVLIRAVEPLNFEGRCNGPGLLTNFLYINKNFNSQKIFDNECLWIECSKDSNRHEIAECFRIGVKNDLPKKMRFYIRDNLFVSRK